MFYPTEENRFTFLYYRAQKALWVLHMLSRNPSVWAEASALRNRDQELIAPLLPNSIDADNDTDSICEGYLTLDEPELWSAEHLDNLPVGFGLNDGQDVYHQLK